MNTQSFEQLEFQRKNPHLFITPFQSVNIDGSITTFDDVTKRLRESRLMIVGFARQIAVKNGEDPEYWFLLPELKPTKDLVDFIDKDMRRAALSFAEHYKYSLGRR